MEKEVMKDSSFYPYYTRKNQCKNTVRSNLYAVTY